MKRTVVEVSPGPSLPTTFSAQISQPVKPSPSVMPPVALVEIETAAQLIPGPRGSLWYTGSGAPSSIVGQAIGDMYLDDSTDHVWRFESGGWVDTGTDLHGSPDNGADILAKLVTVDGAGSGLDADLLDGQHASFFASQANLDAETAARTGADNTLQTNIASEASARASADTTLQTNITNEATTRATNDNALQTQINTKLGDAPNDGQQYARKNLAWAAVVIPPSGIPEAPTDGQQYARQSAAWAAVAIPPGTIMQDAPPSSPQPGQFWYDTDSGGLYLWYADGSSNQWIQVNGAGLVGNPARQSFVVGSTGVIIPVPPGAKHCKLSGRFFGATANLAPVIRISFDGTTIISGATDYTWGGNTLYTGSAGNPTKSVPITASYWPLLGYTDRTTEPMFIDVDIMTQKAAGSYFGYRSRGWSYHSAATAVWQDALYAGYTGSAHISQTEIKAIQLTCSGGTFAGPPNSYLAADWFY